MTDAQESEYIQGQRAANISMLRHCLRELGYDSPEAKEAAWIIEREAAIATLRNACDDFGDNDWEPDLHLADIIDKHLVPGLRRLS